MNVENSLINTAFRYYLTKYITLKKKYILIFFNALYGFVLYFEISRQATYTVRISIMLLLKMLKKPNYINAVNKNRFVSLNVIKLLLLSLILYVLKLDYKSTQQNFKKILIFSNKLNLCGIILLRLIVL